jgi:hypothetical protein
VWKHSSGHNANLLLAKADSVGFAVARNENTHYKTFWAMVIADKSPRNKKNSGKVAAKGEMRRAYASAEPSEPSENPIDALKSLVCKYLC